FGYGRAAVEMFKRSPWFGVGLGSFHTMVGDYQYSIAGGPLVGDNAQNWIRHNLAEIGIVGSLGWIAWALVIAAMIVTRHADRRSLRAVVILSTLVAIVAVSQVGMPTQNCPMGVTFWTFLFWYFARRPEHVPARRPDARALAPRWQWAVATVVV